MKKWLPLLLLLSACAVVVHPTGGDKDEIPPSVKRTIPDSHQVNFIGREIRIYFDEYFEIADPNGLLISPPPAKTPKLEVVNKYLRIQFKEPLRDNSTYSVQLFGVVHDVNEKNVLSDYSLSFSTGNEIDTGYIFGHVNDNYTGEKMEAYTVALFYPNISDYPDSVIFPLYLSRTSANGSFTLPAIRNDSFTLYAFNDINHNKRIDFGEDMGYIPTNVNTYDTVNVYVAKNALDPSLVTYPPIVKDRRGFLLPFRAPENGRISITSAQQSFDKSQVLFTDRFHSDTLHVIDFIKYDYDSLVTYYISLNDIQLDTVQVKFPRVDPAYLLHLKRNKPLIPGQPVLIRSNQIIRDVRKEKSLLLYNDSLHTTSYSVTSSNFELKLDHSFLEKLSYTFILQDSAIHYYDGTFSKPDTFHFRIAEKTGFGDAAILLSNTSGRLLEIQLLKELKEDPLFTTHTQSDSVYFSNLPTGAYYVRVLYPDSSGKPNKVIPFRQMPTKVYVHPQKLVIRGGWTIGDFILNNNEE